MNIPHLGKVAPMGKKIRRHNGCHFYVVKPLESLQILGDMEENAPCEEISR
jgi:hypothetical protein